MLAEQELELDREGQVLEQVHVVRPAWWQLNQHHRRQEPCTGESDDKTLRGHRFRWQLDDPQQRKNQYRK